MCIPYGIPPSSPEGGINHGKQTSRIAHQWRRLVLSGPCSVPRRPLSCQLRRGSPIRFKARACSKPGGHAACQQPCEPESILTRIPYKNSELCSIRSSTRRGASNGNSSNQRSAGELSSLQFSWLGIVDECNFVGVVAAFLSPLQARI